MTATPSTGGTPKVARGWSRATLVLSVGTWSYVTECEDPSTLKTAGTIRVVEDKANRRLPVGASRFDIDADGRTWRVSYQTTIPAIHVKLPAGATKLEASPAAGGARLSSGDTSTGIVVLPPDKLVEGAWELVPLPTGKKTTLVIDFDRTAPQLYIAGARRILGDTAISLEVTGMVAPGWTLQVGSVAVPVDKQRRFRARATERAGRAIIRAEHPKLGVHFYATSAFHP